MKKELIVNMNEGLEIILQGEFTDGENTWNYEYWTNDNGKYKCSYDGEFSQHFDIEDLEEVFNPEYADNVEVR